MYKRAGRLTWREWRWMWLFQAVRAVVVVVLIVPILLAYACQAYAAGMMWLSDQVGKLRTRCYTRDLMRRPGAYTMPGNNGPKDQVYYDDKAGRG
jgi:hypothetical protein